LNNKVCKEIKQIQKIINGPKFLQDQNGREKMKQIKIMNTKILKTDMEIGIIHPPEIKTGITSIEMKKKKITGLETIGITGLETIGITGPETIGITGLETIGITGPETIGITGPETIGITGPRTIGITGSEKIGITGSVKIKITGPGTIGITGPGTIGITGPGTIEITELEKIATEIIEDIKTEMKIKKKHIDQDGKILLNSMKKRSKRKSKKKKSLSLYQKSSNPRLQHGILENIPTSSKQITRMRNRPRFQNPIMEMIISPIISPIISQEFFIDLEENMLETIHPLHQSEILVMVVGN
jgi:hypothetical protein